jgi:hypothetical protein
MLDAVKEIRFGFHLFDSLGISMKLLLIVRTENTEMIVMAENDSSGFHTMHNCTRYHFIREHLEDSFIKIVFIGASDNAKNLVKFLSCGLQIESEGC